MEKTGEINVKRLCYFLNDLNGGISDAAFDSAYISAMQTGFFRKAILRPALGLTHCFYVSAEFSLNFHACIIRELLLISL